MEAIKGQRVQELDPPRFHQTSQYFCYIFEGFTRQAVTSEGSGSILRRGPRLQSGHQPRFETRTSHSPFSKFSILLDTPVNLADLDLMQESTMQELTTGAQR